jgi:predicted enzyme related to lactoylglutathione lyase
MKRVTGIGGVFFKSQDPKRLAEWYRVHLGFDVSEWGGAAFEWSGPGQTLWNPFKADTDHFAPSASPFMINYRVDDLHALLAALREEGCNVLDKVDDSEYGKFGWVLDPDGNKLELWEPPPGQ